MIAFIAVSFIAYPVLQNIHPDLYSDALVRTAKADDGLQSLLAEVEKQLAEIDDSVLLSNYGETGSGVQLEGFGGVLLDLGGKGIESEVITIDGASSIVSDPSGFGFTIALSGDYLFEFDKDNLTLDAQNALDSVYRLFVEYDGNSLKIEGHTDSKGSEEYNLDLSNRRALSVKDWFSEKGVPDTSMTIRGYGEKNPIAPNATSNGEDDPVGRAKNRRVEIVIDTEKKVNHLPTLSDSTAIQE